MRTALGIAICVVLTAGWPAKVEAGQKSPKLPRCDGKARRPANAYGSILPSVDPAAGTVTPSSAPPKNVDVFPAQPSEKDGRGTPAPPPPDMPASTPVPPISALEPRQEFRSC